MTSRSGSCSNTSPAADATTKAFTIGFDDKDYDETPIAMEVAQSVGADQDVMQLKADHLYDNFAETLWHTDFYTVWAGLGHLRDTGNPDLE